MNHQTEARAALAAPIRTIGLICVTFALVCLLFNLFSQGLFKEAYSTTIKGYPPQFTFYKQSGLSPGAPFSVFSICQRNARGDFVEKVWAIYPKHMEEAREEVFVITRLWNTNHRPERAKLAMEASLKKLGLDYVDAYLIHTPFAFRPGDDQDPRDTSGAVIYDKDTTLLDTWRALESFVDDGRCRAIGLSDVNLAMVKEIYEAARVKPAIVHVEAHPYNPEWELLEYCKQTGMVMQAFAPLGHSLAPRLLDDSVVVAIANRVNKTPAQVLLAWALQRGTAVLTTSKTASRIKENFDVSALPQEAMDEINKISTRIRFNTVVDTGVPGFIARSN